jgi:hypothetical protein
MDPCLQTLSDEIAQAMSGLPPATLTTHPPGRWSIAEVLEHLYLTYTGTLKGFERVSAAGKPQATGQSWKERVRTLVVVEFGYLPSGREAPTNTRPRGVPAEQVLTGIGSQIVEMDSAIARCEEKFGPRCRVLDHPVLGALTANEWRKFHLVHGRHHLKQIRRLR